MVFYFFMKKTNKSEFSLIRNHAFVFIPEKKRLSYQILICLCDVFFWTVSQPRVDRWATGNGPAGGNMTLLYTESEQIDIYWDLSDKQRCRSCWRKAKQAKWISSKVSTRAVSPSAWRNLLLDIKGMLSEATSNAAFPSESVITGLFWHCPKSASTRNAFVFVIKRLSPQWTSALVRLANNINKTKASTVYSWLRK